MTVRVRFAPSPTGYLHVGAARTALYNWLFARHHDGVLIHRSDDTDTERNSDEFATDITDALAWLGVDWDEGIDVGGPHGSYRQSGRLDRYRFVVDQLLASGAAYYDAATSEQLDALRKEAHADGRSPVYDGRYRASDAGPEDGLPVRLAIPRPGETRFDDAVRGEVVFDHANVDDFIILRSDGLPTYHLASTVDDVDYEISHVIRGEDLLSSTPKHILLTQAMGAEPPTYGHLSLLVGPDGKKLSKRHGDTALRAYREAGHLGDAMRNYLAILGWSPGDDEEILPADEMVKRFDLGAVTTNAAVFDPAKLEWMNGVYLREMEAPTFAALTKHLVEEDLGRELDDDEADVFAGIVPHVQERAKLLTEVPPQVRFLFVDEVAYDERSWSKVMKGDAETALDGAIEALSDLDPWSTEAIEAALRGMLDEHELSARKGLQPIRVAITGSSVSPPLFESLEALGSERSVERLREARSRL